MRIAFEEVEYCYSKGTPFERLALYDMNVCIEPTKYYAVIGHTGSGKSTFIQHLNGLLQPTSGIVRIGETCIEGGKKHKGLKTLRKKVGIVFQFPEHQLFEETVEKDICFGPMNFGVSEEEAKKMAKELIVRVGLSLDILTRSPFELSGGQMRRVAIAGVLAMEPDILVLDEPTVGLDPQGQRELMEMFYSLHKERKLTTVLVTHHMEDAAKYGDEIVVLHKGTTYLKGTPEEVFAQSDKLKVASLALPITMQYQQLLEDKLGVKFDGKSFTIDELSSNIVKLYGKGDGL